MSEGRREQMKKPFLFAFALVLAAVLLIGATITGYTDWQKRAAPGNPAAANLRMFADSATAKFKCLDSTGASCYFDNPPVGATLWSGNLAPNGAVNDVGPHNMTSDTAPSPVTASTNSAFLQTGGTSWNMFDSAGANGRTVLDSSGFGYPGTGTTLDLGNGNGKTLTAYAVQNSGSDNLNYSPKAWTLSGSNDNSSYTTLDTATNQTGWGSSETRTFVFSPPPINYRYFRLIVTANNGGAFYYIVKELSLIISTTNLSSGTPGDFYMAITPKAIYGPRPSGAAPTWPLFGTLN
jgi:hypothetical protein